MNNELLNLDAIDENLMKKAFEAAHQDYLAGRCIPHAQVMDMVKERLGWK